MKYKLIIDKNAEESITVVAHAPSELTRQIENLVCSHSGADSLTGYGEDELRRLPFGEIECITVINRRVVAIDVHGKRYRLQERLRELEERLPSATVGNCKFRQPPGSPFSGLLVKSELVATVATN